MFGIHAYKLHHMCYPLCTVDSYLQFCLAVVLGTSDSQMRTPRRYAIKKNRWTPTLVHGNIAAPTHGPQVARAG